MDPIKEGYILRIGRVFSVNPEENTVGVKLVSRINHRVNKWGGIEVTRGDYFDEYDITLEDVNLNLTTEEYYYTSGSQEDMPSNKNAWKMFLPCHRGWRF